MTDETKDLTQEVPEDQEAAPLPEEETKSACAEETEADTEDTAPKEAGEDKDSKGKKDKKEKEKTTPRQDFYIWTQALVAVLVGIVLAATLAGRVIRVVGSSMVPTLHDRDVLLLQSVGYTPRQGDVVVLRKEAFMSYPIVKRVIATGGQHVTVDYTEGTVTVDGVVLDEPYINEPMGLVGTAANQDMTVLDVTVPEGSIYVMGDNRNHSSDSRCESLGTVDQRYVLGRVLCVLLPFSDFGAVE